MLSLVSQWYVELIFDEELLAGAQPYEIRHRMFINIVGVLLVLATIVTNNTCGVMMTLQQDTNKSFAWSYLELYRSQRNQTKVAISIVTQMIATQSYRGFSPTRKA